MFLGKTKRFEINSPEMGISMDKKKKERAVVYRQQEIADGIYDMWINTGLAKQAVPGQFISVYTQDKSMLLPRPISICDVDRQNNRLRIVYRVVGQGTREFSQYHSGNPIDILGTLGNGFPIEESAQKRVFLIGGGIGIPPLLYLASELYASKSAAKPDIILGYRNNELFLAPELEKYGSVHIATEDGSAGIKGNVIDVIQSEALEADIIYACGPMPMLRALKRYSEEHSITAYISLEERMACGVGACLGCVVKTKNKDHHSHVNNARICTDGPVYNAAEVDI